MRVRRLVWRTAGSAAGRRAPRAVAAYYDAVVRSLTRALLRIDGVESVYAAGLVRRRRVRGGPLGRRPRRRDRRPVARGAPPHPPRGADRVPPPPGRPADRPHAARGRGLPARRGDPRALPAGGSRRRSRATRSRAGASSPAPTSAAPLADPPDGRLVRLTDGHVIEAAAALARGDEPGVAKALWPLVKDAEAEGLDVADLEAAYAMVVEAREREALPLADDPPAGPRGVARAGADRRASPPSTLARAPLRHPLRGALHRPPHAAAGGRGAA